MQATHGMRPLAYAWGLQQKVKLIITPRILTPWENRSDCMNMCHPLHSKRRLHRKKSVTIGNRLAYLFAWKRPKNYIMECPFFTLLSVCVYILHWNKARHFLRLVCLGHGFLICSVVIFQLSFWFWKQKSTKQRGTKNQFQLDTILFLCSPKI